MSAINISPEFGNGQITERTSEQYMPREKSRIYRFGHRRRLNPNRVRRLPDSDRVRFVQCCIRNSYPPKQERLVQ